MAIRCLVSFLFAAASFAAEYEYLALDARGVEVRRTIESPSEAAAINELRRKGLYPTQIAPVAAGGIGTRATTTPYRPPPVRPAPVNRLFSTREHQLGFWEDVSMLLDAGKPVLTTLELIADSGRHATYAEAALAMARDLQNGHTLSEAMGRHPRVFDEFAVNLVKAGELGGTLEVAIGRLIDRLRVELRLRNRPWFWMFSSAVAFSALVLATLNLVGMRTGWKLPASIGLILAVVATSNFFFETHPIRHREMALALGTVGTCIETGVPILQSLSLTKNRCGSREFQRFLEAAHQTVRNGDEILVPCEKSGLFSAAELAMVETGEQTGLLPEIFLRLAGQHAQIWEHSRANVVKVHQITIALSAAMLLSISLLPAGAREGANHARDVEASNRREAG